MPAGRRGDHVPTYAYVCTECGHEFEIVQAISDSSLTTCPECSGALRKVFHPVGVAFKGSGFYRTDSRGDTGASKESEGAKEPAAKPAAAASGDSGSGGAAKTPAAGSGDSGGSTSKPAAAKPASTG
jgi:putative FmdB family regulatory protein